MKDSKAQKLAFAAQSSANATDKARVRSARWAGLSLVSQNKQSLTGPLKAVATAGTVDTTRVRHVNMTGKALSHLALVYANYAPAGGTESSSSQIQIRAAIENLSPSGVATQDQPRQPAETTAGTNSRYTFMTLDRAGVLQTKAMTHRVAPGGAFYVRTGVTVPLAATSFPRGGCLFGGTSAWGTNNGEGSDAGSDRTMDGSTASSANTSPYYYSESAVLGRLADGSVATSVAIMGDSIADGVDDCGIGGPYIGGIEIRAFAAVPYLRICIPGEKLADIVSANGFTVNFYARQQLQALTTHVSCGYGRNDAEQGQTLAQFKANLLALAFICMARGQHFLQWTVLPAPTSTDGWLTTANQTPQATGAEALRVSYNAWLTDATATGFVAQANAQVAGLSYPGQAFVIDRCAPIEVNAAGALTVGGGRVLPVQSGTTDTGTATAASVTSITDTSKAWAVNAWQGWAVYIVSGTGAGQIRGIAYNSATTLTLNNSFSTAPDTTSVYRIAKVLGMNGVHPFATLHNLVAADATVQAKVAAFLGS